MAASSPTRATATHDTGPAKKRNRNVDAAPKKDSPKPREITDLQELDMTSPFEEHGTPDPGATAQTDPPMVGNRPAVEHLDNIRWRGISLTKLEWNLPADRADGEPAGIVSGQIEQPFQQGSVRAGIHACGCPTGRYDVESVVTLAGHQLATVAFQSELAEDNARLPTVDFDGASLHIQRPTLSLGSINPTPGAEAATTAGPDGGVFISMASVQDLPPEVAALFAGVPAVEPAPRTVDPVAEELVQTLRQLVDGLLAVKATAETPTEAPATPAPTDASETASPTSTDPEPEPSSYAALMAFAPEIMVMARNFMEQAFHTVAGEPDATSETAGPTKDAPTEDAPTRDATTEDRITEELITGVVADSLMRLGFSVADPAAESDQSATAATDGRGESTELPSSVVTAIAELLSQSLDSLQILIRALTTQDGMPVDGVVVEGSSISFAPGVFNAESETGLDLIIRAVSAALAGQDGAIDAESPAAPGTAPSPPDAAGPPAAVDRTPGSTPDTEADADPLPDADTPAETGAAPVDDVAGGDPEGGIAEQPEAAEYELLLPPAPSSPVPEHRAAIGGVRSRTTAAGSQTQDVPSAQSSTQDARDATTIPASEQLGRAQQAVATALDQQVEPSPEIVELCAGISAAIRAKRPVDQDELLSADLREPAEQAGNALNASVQQQGDAVGQNYAAVDEPPTPAEARPAEVPTVPEASIGSPDLTAAHAAPPPIADSDLDLANDQAQVGQRVDESGIHTPVTEQIPDGPFAQARDGEQQLNEVSANRTAEVRAEQQQAIASSQEQMAELQQQALAAFNQSREASVRSTAQQQSTMTETEADTRNRLSAEANGVFTDASARVRTLLSPLSSTAMDMWRADLATLTTDFRQNLDVVKREVDERHAGVGGAIVAWWDDQVGLPKRFTDAYDRAERDFSDGVCDSLSRISIHVNTVIASIEGIIATAEDEIRRIFTENLPEGLESWAAQQLGTFETRLTDLRSEVEDTRKNFLREVSNEAVSAVQAVQTEVQALREEAKGVIDKILDALAEFIEDPATAIINGLLRVVGIPPDAFWGLLEKIPVVIDAIADDPVSFINNLVDGVRGGFEGFFERFPTHVIAGFWDWLFSGLEGGVALPEDFTMQSLVTFALDLMGLSWDAIREILVKHIGEENVELIEQAWDLLSLLLEKGIDGVLEMVQEYLDPARILDLILEAAIDYLVTTLIKVVVERVVSLLNPVGIIFQAIKLIWDVLSWIFRNAARIFRFVETVVNGVADIVAGNIGAMAKAVEGALASLIPVVIDFLAQLMGLGGLPDAVAEVIVDLRKVVLKAVDTAIGFLIKQAKALLAKLGFGGEEDADGEGGDDPEAEDENAGDTELGEEIRFNADGESHRLWIDNDGTNATLMIASNPTTVPAQLAAWEDEAKALEDEDKKAKAMELLARAKPLAATIDIEADEVADLYATAAVNNGEPPPSDASIESNERKLARVFDDLFTLFGTAAGLKGKQLELINKMHPLARLDAEVEVAKSDFKKGTTPETLEAALIASALIGAAHKQPTHTSPSRFTRFAERVTIRAARTVDPTFEAKNLHPRKEHITADSQKAYYKEIVCALHDALWKNVDPSTDLVAAFKELLSEIVDPDLKDAVGRGPQGVVDFLKKLDTGAAGPNGKFTKGNFDQTVWVGANMEFLKSRYRDARGRHEWLPTNMIAQVLQATNAGFEALQWDNWVDLQHSMRSDTQWVILQPPDHRGMTENLQGDSDRETLTGHSGALYHDVSGKSAHRPLTGGTVLWHNSLRKQFEADSPRDTIVGLQTVALETLWDGSTLPSGYLRKYYQSSTATKPIKLTDLKTDYRKERGKMVKQFEGWLKKAGNT